MFEHKIAPRCKSDGDCEFYRQKICMFSHQRQNQQLARMDWKRGQISLNQMSQRKTPARERISQEVQMKGCLQYGHQLQEYLQYIQWLRFQNQTQSWNQVLQNQHGI